MAPIDSLPLELLLDVFKLFISDTTPVRDLSALSVVCKPWHHIITGTPSLWSCIAAEEGLQCVRRALKMAEGAPLDIRYSPAATGPDLVSFLNEVQDRSNQWRKLEIRTDQTEALGALSTIYPSYLLSLHMEAAWAARWTPGIIVLFGGKPAPRSLKELTVHRMPIDLAPLRLSGLKHLQLSESALVSADEILRILQDSPELESLSLYNLPRLADFKPTATQEGHPIINLSNLHIFDVNGVPVAFTHLALSLIRVPNLRTLVMECQLTGNRTPRAQLLTARIDHLSVPVQRLVQDTDHGTITAYSDKYWGITVGEIFIGLKGRALQHSHLKEVLDWFGPRIMALPFTIRLDEFDIYASWASWVGSLVTVAGINIWTGSFGAYVSGRSSPKRPVVSLLALPPLIASRSWFLPSLEYLDTNVINENGKKEILDMVKARHAAYLSNETRETPPKPKPLKWISLRGGRNGVPGDVDGNLEFLSELRKVAIGAEISWDGTKWTG